jgi:hypothetical protein
MNAFTFFVVYHRCSQELRKPRRRRAGAVSSAATEPGPHVLDGVEERDGAVAQEARRIRCIEEGAGRGSEVERRTTQWQAWRWWLGALVSLTRRLVSGRTTQWQAWAPGGGGSVPRCRRLTAWYVGGVKDDAVAGLAMAAR